MSAAEILKTITDTILIPLCIWILYTVHRLDKRVEINVVYGKQHEQEVVKLWAEINDTKSRLQQIDAQLLELRLRFPVTDKTPDLSHLMPRKHPTKPYTP
ncbi:hypothetical protein [Geminisphaera colitermitum]|uniref:hypothetical protein n=1 Tax=Geminisphaera colitermitum TaxID=1148786 RepID=UPI000158CDC6|nr:hypothetical protein [Geminisphaera colitermitum]